MVWLDVSFWFLPRWTPPSHRGQIEKQLGKPTEAPELPARTHILLLEALFLLGVHTDMSMSVWGSVCVDMSVSAHLTSVAAHAHPGVSLCMTQGNVKPSKFLFVFVCLWARKQQTPLPPPPPPLSLPATAAQMFNPSELQHLSPAPIFHEAHWHEIRSGRKTRNPPAKNYVSTSLNALGSYFNLFSSWGLTQLCSVKCNTDSLYNQMYEKKQKERQEERMESIISEFISPRCPLGRVSKGRSYDNYLADGLRNSFSSSERQWPDMAWQSACFLSSSPQAVLASNTKTISCSLHTDIRVEA